MANVTESPTFEAGIYRIETSDPVVGGESGISNLPHKQLANRTSFLKVEQDAIKGKLNAAGIGQASEIGDIDLLVTSGLHYSSDAEYHLLHLNRNEDEAAQVYIEGQNMGFRSKVEGSWNPFRNVLSGSDVDRLVPIGTIISSARATPPTGYVKANGADLTRSTYSALFSAIGLRFAGSMQKFSGTVNSLTSSGYSSYFTSYATGQAVTFQAVPGGSLPSPLVEGTVYYLRIVDPQDIRIHPTQTDAVNNTNPITLANTNEFFFHDSTKFPMPDLRGEFVRGWDDGRGVDSARRFGSSQVDLFKSHTHAILQNGNDNISQTGSTTNYRSGGDTVLGGSTASTGGTETRPRNVALSYFIKF